MQNPLSPISLSEPEKKSVAIIVAHPDDEVLWAGGTVLSHPQWQCFIACLCRKHDRDRNPKFFKALEILHAKGAMGDLDDGPEQFPQQQDEIELVLRQVLPEGRFDLIITHNPAGEYTRHLRHEEIGAAVIALWTHGKLDAGELLVFAYEDGNKNYLPRAIETADLYFDLPPDVWQQKYDLITNTYGFPINSWEARTTPKAETFYKFTSWAAAGKWLTEKQKK